MRPVSHLLPCVNPVAVCAQQAQVPAICRPVFKPVVPCGRAPKLLRPIDVIDVEDSHVGLSAFHACAAERSNKGKLSLPVPGTLVHSKAVLVPVGCAAFVGAEAVLALCSAPFALRASLPSGRQITGAAAVFAGSVFQAVKVGLKLLFAVLADCFNAAFLHCASISRTCEPKYFDIACRRIEDAQRQARLIP